MFRRKSKEKQPQETQSQETQSKSQEKKSCESAKLENCKKELAEAKDNLIRVSADLQNFKKRVEKEKIHWIDMAQSELINNLLSIIDDFDRALEQGKKEPSEDRKVFLDGLSMIHKSLYKFLENNKVKEITKTELFDPEFHEAISQIDSPNHKSGQIIEVIQKGFFFKNRVLRPAKVIVAK